VTTLLLRAGMLAAGVRHWRPVRRMAANPYAAQRHALLRIVRANGDTRFGREYGFRELDDIRTYQERVPILEYEALRPYIDDQRRTGAAALTVEAPAFYAQTSGSTAAPKYIPVTPTSLAMHRHEQALFSYLQYRACPAAFTGKAWGIMGAAVESTLDSGHAVGSVSGHLYRSLPRAIRARFVVPSVVSTIDDYDAKFRTILCLALAEPDITYLGTPNPSTLLRLVSLLNAERDELLDVVAAGDFGSLRGLPAAVRQSLRIRPNPQRAAALRRLDRLTYANTWPHIRLVTTWTGGSCGIAVEALRRELPAGARVMELGYQATEVRGTIALDAGTPAGLPALHHHFFEFAEPAAWDAGDRSCLTLEALEAGRTYYVIVSTAAGLYRYFMNDLLEVCGHFERTPLLRFVQKGKGVTSLTGEKLYEAQAIAAVQQAARTLGVEATFFLVIADEVRGGYELMLETEDTRVDGARLAAAVDGQLGLINIEYHSKRASGRLQPLTVTRLRPGSSEAHKAAYLRSGQREAQFKPVILQYRRDLRWTADQYALW
jgi:hypothetical protein